MDGIFFPFPYVGTVFCFYRHKTKNQGAALHLINAPRAYHQGSALHIITPSACISSTHSVAYHQGFALHLITPRVYIINARVHIIKALPCISSRPRVHLINACVAYHQGFALYIITPRVYTIKALPCNQKYNFIKHTEPPAAQKEKKWRFTRRFRQT